MMTGSRRTALTMALASALLIAAWQASADSCDVYSTALGCGPASAVVSISRNALFLSAAAKSEDVSPLVISRASPGPRDTKSNGSESASLLLLGVGLALIARSLKRQRPAS